MPFIILIERLYENHFGTIKYRDVLDLVSLW